MALLERKEEILKPKEIAEIEPAGAKERIITITYTQERLQFEGVLLEA
jgi:hypothetical protein